MKWTILAVAAALTVAGCTKRAGVNGQFEDSTVTLAGTSIDFAKRGGEIRFRTSEGVTCKGDYVFTTKTDGEGVFHCSDDASGPFTINLAADRMIGRGILHGTPFTFTVG